MGLDQHGWIGGIAKNSRDTRIAQCFHQFAVLLSHHKRDVACRQSVRHATPYPSVTHQDHLPREIT
ncbi:hypothetical protein D3C87_2155880 [compost metagenome]